MQHAFWPLDATNAGPIILSMTHRAIWSTGTDFVPGAVPAHLEDPTGAPVAVNQGSGLKQQFKQTREWSLSELINTFSQFESDAHRRVPDVHTLIEGAAGQVLAIGAEGHAVDGFLVFGQRVNADASLHIPQSHSRVERGAE